MSQWIQSQAADFYDTGYKSWSHGMINVSIPEMSVLKKGSTLALSVPLNLFIKLGFVCVNSLREGAKGDWDFRISDLVKNPDGTDT